MSQNVKLQWARFGRELRRLRIQAGLSQHQVGKHIAVTYAMISSIERGVRGARREHVVQLDQLFSTNGALQRMWDSLSASRRFPAQFQGIDALEPEASEIREYQSMVVPGLLQTEDYARTVLRDGQRSDTDAEIDSQVHTRLERQSILADTRPPLLLVVLDEGVLRRPIGGRTIMKGQLDNLLEVSAGSRVLVHIVPLATEHHPGLSEGFWLFTLPDGSEMLYMETRFSGNTEEDAEAVAYYTRLFSELRGAALPLPESRRLIKWIREEF